MVNVPSLGEKAKAEDQSGQDEVAEPYFLVDGHIQVLAGRAVGYDCV